MTLRRIFAILRQEYYITRRSLEVIMDLFFVSAVSVVLFGFVSAFLATSIPGPGRYYLLLGMLLWEVVRVGQYSISVGAMWNIWSHNLSNLFISPLTVGEYVAAAMLSSVAKVLVTLGLVAAIAATVFDFNLLAVGLVNLIGFVVNLLLFAWVSGLVILGLIFRFGTRIQALAWGLIALFQPLTAAVFPVAVLPPLLRAVAYGFPPTYVFEAARASLADPAVDWRSTSLALGLNLLYLILALAYFRFMFYRSRVIGQFARNEQ